MKATQTIDTAFSAVCLQGYRDGLKGNYDNRYTGKLARAYSRNYNAGFICAIKNLQQK